MTIAEFIAKRDGHRESAETHRQIARSSMAVFRYRGVIRDFSKAREHDIIARRMTQIMDRFAMPGVPPGGFAK